MIYAGDSWALKGFTEQNYNVGNSGHVDGNERMADYWGIEYKHCLAPGQGNLTVLDKLLMMNIPTHVPIVWVYTEPGRDYGRITGNPEFDWIKSEDIFSIRKELDSKIMHSIKEKVSNPITFIGGLSDVNEELAQSLGFDVLHPSWQRWISETLNRTQHFNFGWGASDIGWRTDYNNVKPSKAAVFAWDDLIKEWCMWEELGYFSHEHPSPRANLEFANYLQNDLISWIESVR